MNKTLQEIIDKEIKKLFRAQKARLIGAHFAKGIGFSYESTPKEYSLPQIYAHANLINNLKQEGLDTETVEMIANNALNFINTLEQKTLSDVNYHVSHVMNNADRTGDIKNMSTKEFFNSKQGREVIGQIKDLLEEQKQKIKNGMELIVNDQLHTAQNLGATDGIMKMSESLGIDDPVVGKIGVLDTTRCRICWELWTLEDKVTPRVYKMSELYSQPGNKKGEKKPTVGPSHPQCRDVLFTLMPGFGFDDNGKIIYIGPDHDEWKKQRGVE